MTDPLSTTRRYFLGHCTGLSLGAMSAGGLLNDNVNAQTPARNETGGLIGLPHHEVKAKRVIYLTQSGGPSQIELYDHKPDMQKWAGKDLPDEIRQGQRLTTMTAGKAQLVMPSHAKFRQWGESGATVSEWLPHIGAVADDLCFIKSMHSEYINLSLIHI